MEIFEGGAGLNEGTENGGLGEQEAGSPRREAEVELPSRWEGRAG